MASLEELLQMPWFLPKREWAWRRLTTGETLLRALQEAVQSGSIGEAEPLLSTWREFAEHKDERPRHHWDRAYTLLACARSALAAQALEAHKNLEDKQNPPVDALFPILHAAAEAVHVPCDCDADHGSLRMALTAQGLFGAGVTDRGLTPVHAVDIVFRLLARKGAHPLSSVSVSWAWDITRALLDAPRDVTCRREIPVVGTNGGKGFLATLVLEMMEPGIGEVFHAPEDAFRTYADAEFVAAMRDAWRGASLLAQAQGMEVHTQDGRWQLLREGAPATEANDRSASGAAAWGWWYALTGKVPDAEVIVLAQVDKQGRLQGVEDVPTKTRTIATDGCLDTIVVATSKDRGEAETTLLTCVKTHAVMVVPLDTTTLERLVQIRSVQAQNALAYLSQLASVLDDTPWMRGSERLKASAIAVEPFVLTKEERSRASRLGYGDTERTGVVERHAPIDDIEAQRYELPVRDEQHQEERWWQVVRRDHVRLGLHGAPGSGKTFITRHTVASLARQSVAKIEKQEVSFAEVTIPLWVTAKALAQASASEISDALLEAFQQSELMQLEPYWRTWLRREIGGPRAFIVVDALDELLDNDRVGFQTQVKRLEHVRGHVLVTCRTMQWQERKDWLGWHRFVEVELAPFTSRQQRECVRQFFAGDHALAHRMEKLLQDNFALRHACTSPLLLAFGCLLHEEELVNEGTTRALLYGHMTRKMIIGAWRGVQRAPWMASRVQEERCLRFLEDIAWGLFAAAPQVNRFTLDAWEQAAARVKHRKPLIEPDEFLEQLEQVGFVVPAGFDEQRGDRCWSVVHRTFLEFLAARALTRIEQGIWLQEAKQHFWFQPEWLEVLTFLAGLVDDVTPLLQAVEEEQKNDDLFGSMLYLKARLIGAAKQVDEGIVRRVCAEVVSFWHGTCAEVVSFWKNETYVGWRNCLQGFVLPMFATLAGNAAAREMLAEGVLKLTRDENRWVRRTAPAALGRIGTERAIDRLLELTQDGDAWVHHAAIEALGRIGTERTVDRLLELTQYDGESVRQSAAETLGRIGTERAVDRLLELTQYDGDESVRDTAAWGLWQIAWKHRKPIRLK